MKGVCKECTRHVYVDENSLCYTCKERPKWHIGADWSRFACKRHKNGEPLVRMRNIK